MNPNKFMQDAVSVGNTRQFIELTRPMVTRPTSDLLKSLLEIQLSYMVREDEQPIGFWDKVNKLREEEIMIEIANRN